MAPNSEPWPSFAGYIKGYQQLHTDGFSTITVDNSQNDSDVFIKFLWIVHKLIQSDSFIFQHLESLFLKKVTAGNYDIRYRDLSNGGISRSELFDF